jgi:hypothetical protein
MVCNYELLTIYRDFWVGEDIGLDHYPLHTETQFKPKPSVSSPQQERRPEKTNWKKYEEKICGYPPLTPALTTEEVNSQTDLITSQIIDAFHEACPLRNKKKRSKITFSSEIQKRVKKKKKL